MELQLTEEYSEALTELREAYELGKKDIHAALADAETAYAVALREFTEKYENYHMTLKDGDFETTISGSKTTASESKKSSANVKTLADLFDLMFF